MKYHYSHLIDPSSYDDQGLCDGIPLRCHRNSDIEEFGVMRLRNDWQQYIGPLPSSTYGGQGPQYNFTAVTIPHCLPNRLEIVAYVMEFAFLHDDLVDTAETDDGPELYEKIMQDINAGYRNGNVGSGTSGEGRILRGIIQEMSAIDAYRTTEFLAYWKHGASLPRDQTLFASFEDYLDFRLIDSGSFLLTGLMTFGMGLTIPPEEKQECFRLTRPAWLAAFLTNDVQSWEKEWETEYKSQFKVNHTADTPHMEAIHRVLEKVKGFVAELVDTVRNIHNRVDLSEDSRSFVEAAQYMVSGNLIWGASSPRYNGDKSLNELQVERMKHNWPAQLAPAINDTKHPPTPPDEDAKPFDNSSVETNSHYGITPSKSPMDSLALFLTHDFPPLSSLPISSPTSYISSLPSKSVRDRAADALNTWLSVPDSSLIHIKHIVNKLHNASLILDDMEDGSSLRRGSPAVHTVFGPATAMNSAGWQVVEAVRDLWSLGDEECGKMCLEELSNMYIGQGHDIFWSTNLTCPSLKQYLKMVDYKTGGLFRILVRLMMAKSSTPPRTELTALASMMGRYFQIRDDYMNLTSGDYTAKKGFCEDLDEGKFSLMMVHTMQVASEADKMLLQNLLMQRRVSGNMSMSQKQLVLERMRRSGSMEYTAKVLEVMLVEIRKMVGDIESECGLKNELIRSLLGSLDIEREKRCEDRA